MKKIAKIEDIPIGGTKLVFIKDTPIMLFNIKGKIQAWDNRCPHRGASLIDGNILCRAPYKAGLIKSFIAASKIIKFFFSFFFI